MAKQVDEKAERYEREMADALKRDAAISSIGKFAVSFGELSGVYEARDPGEARAMFNDAHKTSYGPKVPGWKVARVEA